ncbi:MAG: HAMP domain-containing sensor histidine kinase [Pseudomonadota bacterium]|nr:HAMP domain-containing sensor histidine kinase [Pseudomonadota bacterium]
MKVNALPLFWRIFLSIWLAMVVTIVASQLASKYLLERERQAIERLVGLQELAREALTIRETQGRGDAWRFLKAEGDRLDLHLLLVEKEEGQDQLPQSIRDRIRSGWYPHKPAVIGFDDAYQLVAWPRAGSDGWLDPRLFRIGEWLLAFLMISLACWLIARMVSRPLRHMEGTAQAIAAGDTSLRVDPRIASRGDEVGLLAAAFNAMTDRLCQLLERQNHLMRDISHDLRTPLARQRVAIELAADSGADESLMDSILRQNERLEAMTGQILTLYRVSEKGSDIEREPVKPMRVVNQVLVDAADYAEHQGVDCRLQADETARNVSVLGDAGLLQRAIDNVVQNALDHTPPGKSVHVHLGRDGRQVVVSVTDEGPGAPDDMLPNLFEPFFRADKSRGGTGWGLGLAIAKDILAAHEGQIRAHNQPGSGLTVTMTLPLFLED